MDRTDFGKTVLDEITLQLKAGDEADDLIRLLQAIESGLVED